MHATTGLVLLVGLLLTRQTVSANVTSALFDKSPHGQAEWSRFCSASATHSSETLPFACFTLHDDISSAAHSSSQELLGFASSSGQDFVVTAPKAGENSNVEFFASGFWFRVGFSANTGCAKVVVMAPTRRIRKQGEEPDFEPFMQGTSCILGDKHTFRL